MNLDGKVVLVTGAGKGAGRKVAQLFASQGARVAANDISPMNTDELAEKSNGRIRSYTEDVAKKVGVQAVINQVEDELGSIDILVNHARVQPLVPLLEVDEWDWHRVLDVNITGAFLAMQSAARVMRQKGGGLIFNLISIDAADTRPQAAYLASMYALAALTQAAAAELAAHQIRVHALGTGLAAFQRADAAIPRTLNEAILYLCGSTLNGQIVNLEEQ